MKRDESVFDEAVRALQTTEPDAVQVLASAKRVANRLGIDDVDTVVLRAIDGCEDVRQMFPSYRAGSLPTSQKLLIEAHLHDCSSCRLRLKGGLEARGIRWLTPPAARVFTWHPRAFAWTLASALAILFCGLFVYKAYWQIPPGVRAEVKSINGAAYRISDRGDSPLMPGDTLAEGERVRTGGGAQAVLQLADGSTLEINERSVLSLGARGRNATITLRDGAVIVQAAVRTAGHLYVKTPDCRVGVTGTVFSVNSGIKGSHVAVLQGSVDVLHAGVDSVVHAGEQVSTSENLTPALMEKQFAWSQDREKYLTLLAQFGTLQKRIEEIPFPQPRHTSDLIDKVPSDSLLYISIPNLGDFVSQANRIFDEQLKQSPALQEWWDHGKGKNIEELDALVDKFHQMSQYFGDEIVIVGLKQAGESGFAIVADVKKPGLEEFLRSAVPTSIAGGGITVLDANSLKTAPSAIQHKAGGFALVLQNRVAFSNSLSTLRRMETLLNSGNSGFESGDFGKQIGLAYSRGAGIILAADIQQMIKENARLAHNGRPVEDAITKGGIDGLRYLIAEHRELNGQPENHLALQFSGKRQRVASWLAAPAPIGSLEFVSPNAAIAMAAISKDPSLIADDILAMTTGQANDKDGIKSEIEAKLGINIRDDLAATLGGDFLIALDGPVLPTPSWKAVIEVRDSQRLQETLEKLTEALRNHTQSSLNNGKRVHSIVIEPSDVNGQRYYSVRDLTSGVTVARYTFANGYMLIAPTSAILMEALHTYATGDSLSHTASFRALLPKDSSTDYSAIAYQNLSPVIAPLLAQLGGESADILRKLAADARPTVICARGGEDRIDASTDSRLFGFDILTLGTLIDLGNKHPGAYVRE